MEIFSVVEQPLGLQLAPPFRLSQNTYHEGTVNAVVPKDFLRLLATTKDQEDAETIYDETSKLPVRVLTPPELPNNEFLLAIGDCSCDEDWSRLWNLHNILEDSKKSVQFKFKCRIKFRVSIQSSHYGFEADDNDMTMQKTFKGVLPSGVFLSKRIKLNFADNLAHLSEWKNPDVFLEASVSLSVGMDVGMVATGAQKLERNKWKDCYQRVTQRLKQLGNIVGISANTTTANVNDEEVLESLIEQLEKKLMNMTQNINQQQSLLENNQGSSLSNQSTQAVIGGEQTNKRARLQ